VITTVRKWLFLGVLIIAVPHVLNAEPEVVTESFDQFDLADSDTVEKDKWNMITKAVGTLNSHGVAWQYEAAEAKPEWQIDGPGLIVRGSLKADFPGGLDRLSLKYRGVYQAAAISVTANGKMVSGDLKKVLHPDKPGTLELTRDDFPRGDLSIEIKPVHWCLIDDLTWTLSAPMMKSASALPDGTGVTVMFSRSHGLKIGQASGMRLVPKSPAEQAEAKTLASTPTELAIVEVPDEKSLVLRLPEPGLPENGWDQFEISREGEPNVAMDRTANLAAIYRHWPALDFITGSRVQPWRESDVVAKGWDWSLPPEAKPCPNSAVRLGFNGWRYLDKLPLPDGATVVDELWYRWRDLEPEQGKFNFDGLRKAIAERTDAGCDGVVLRLLGTLWSRTAIEGETPDHWVGSTPEWLGHIPRIVERTDDAVVEMIDPTEPEFHLAYCRMLEALSESGILAQKELNGALICWTSRSNGEEGEGYPGEDPERVARTKSVMDAWATAMGDRRHRLMWVGSGNPRENRTAGYMEHAREIGIGQRSGFVETYLINAPNHQIGQRITEQRYLEVDESNGFIAGGAMFGDENEEYLPWEKLHGAVGTFPYRYHNSMLRFLQMRRNYLYTCERGPEPELLDYVIRTMGWTAKDSPDAWCALRETSLSPFGHESSPGPLKNLERWVYQRDVPGMETEPVEAFPHPVRDLWLAPRDEPRQFIARQGRQIGFAVDDGFLDPGNEHRIVIKITFLNKGNGTWQIRDTQTPSRVLGEVRCEDSGELRTATFICGPTELSGKGMDQDLIIEGLKDYRPTIAMLRIVKVAP